MSPYQQRVVDELNELEERRSKLVTYITTNDHFYQLPNGERVRLYRQNAVMAEYGAILKQRIAAFPPDEDDPA